MFFDLSWKSISMLITWQHFMISLPITRQMCAVRIHYIYTQQYMLYYTYIQILHVFMALLVLIVVMVVTEWNSLITILWATRTTCAKLMYQVAVFSVMGSTFRPFQISVLYNEAAPIHILIPFSSYFLAYTVLCVACLCSFCVILTNSGLLKYKFMSTVWIPLDTKWIILWLS